MVSIHSNIISPHPGCVGGRDLLWWVVCKVMIEPNPSTDILVFSVMQSENLNFWCDLKSQNKPLVSLKLNKKSVLYNCTIQTFRKYPISAIPPDLSAQIVTPGYKKVLFYGEIVFWLIMLFSKYLFFSECFQRMFKYYIIIFPIFWIPHQSREKHFKIGRVIEIFVRNGSLSQE